MYGVRNARYKTSDATEPVGQGKLHWERQRQESLWQLEVTTEWLRYGQLGKGTRKSQTEGTAYA